MSARDRIGHRGMQARRSMPATSMRVQAEHLPVALGVAASTAYGQHSWQAQVQRFLLAMASVRAADEVERSGRFKCSGPLRLVDSAL